MRAYVAGIIRGINNMKRLGDLIPVFPQIMRRDMGVRFFVNTWEESASSSFRPAGECYI